MVVDDVAMVRRLVADSLSTDPAIVVVGSAANGREALERIPTLRPDLLVLDYEMPEMDGLETLIEVRRRHPGVRIVIFSSYTWQGAKVTLDALWHGADDYVMKARASDLHDATEIVRNQLLTKIRGLFELDGPTPAPATTGPAGTTQAPGPLERSATRLRTASSRVEVVVIGASTGGPRALSRVLERIPPQFPLPILVVQHMAPVFTKHLAERLAQQTSLPCAEAEDGARAEPGSVAIAPGDRHMIVEESQGGVRIRLTADPPVHSCRPALDPLFQSAAAVYRAGTLGVVLTGMGVDGVDGASAIRSAGGQVVVQNQASSVVWGMPGAVARQGFANEVLDLDSIGDASLKRAPLQLPRRSPVS